MFFTHAAQFGGAEKSLAELSEGLDPNRFELSALSLAEGPLMDYFRARNIPVYRVEPPDSVLNVRRRSAFVPWRIPIQAWRTIGLSRQVGRAVRDLDPDVLYCNSVKAHVIGSFAGFFARIPVLWHFRDAFGNPIARFFFNMLALLFRPAII